ncbi:MAG: hypothetical protein RQ750_13855 [Roseovarius sp.]|nr:hypothetical protein [Roseovarius sp.]
MTFTLTELEAVFKRLGAVGQIQLIEHLACIMDCADGVNTLACAHDYADSVLRPDASEAEREAVIEGVLYPLVMRDGKPIADHRHAIAIRVARDIMAIQNVREGGLGGAK